MPGLLCKKRGCYNLVTQDGMVYCSVECSPYGLAFGTRAVKGTWGENIGAVRKGLGIGTTAQLIGVSIEGLRHWVKKGLIPFEVHNGRKNFNLKAVKAAMLKHGLRPQKRKPVGRYYR